MPNLPPGLYGPNHDGLGDPDRFTPADRRNAVQARLTSEYNHRTNRSPAIAALQRAADKALGRKARS